MSISLELKNKNKKIGKALERFFELGHTYQNTFSLVKTNSFAD